MSELFTGSTAVKFVNALNKPPLKLSLSYQGLSTFYLYRISNPKILLTINYVLNTNVCMMSIVCISLRTCSCVHVHYRSW